MRHLKRRGIRPAAFCSSPRALPVLSAKAGRKRDLSLRRGGTLGREIGREKSEEPKAPSAPAPETNSHRTCMVQTMVLSLLLISALLPAAFEPVSFLKGYLAVDSASETRRSAEYLAVPLKEAGLTVRFVESSPGQVNLLAELKGTEPALQPLILTHHMDTVHPAWPVREARGIITGSGALDDKSLGVAHLAALLDAVRVPPRRGIVFIAVCGEERGGGDGMGHLAAQGLIPPAAVALGEGGRSASAMDKPLFMNLAVAEKGVLWLEVRKELVGGHGAGVNADAELAFCLKKLMDLPRRLPGTRFYPLVAEYVRWFQRAFPAHARPVPTRAEEVDPALDYMIHTTLNLTSVATDGGDNVLPGSIRATLDVRTLDPADHPAVKEMIGRRLPGWTQQVRLELPPAAPSDPAHPLFRRLLASLERAHPGLPKGPALLGGFSDLRHLRQRGISAFGFSPFFLNFYHEGTVHTRKEAIPRDRFLAGVDLMRSVVHSLCAE